MMRFILGGCSQPNSIGLDKLGSFQLSVEDGRKIELGASRKKGLKREKSAFVS